MFILGATGKVGRELVSQIYDNDTDPHLHKNPTAVVGLASGTSYIYDRNGIGRDDAARFYEKREEGVGYEGLRTFVALLDGSNEKMHLIDVTAATEALDLHRA